MMIRDHKENTKFFKKYFVPKNAERLKNIVFTIDHKIGLMKAEKIEEFEIDYNEWEGERILPLISNIFHEFMRFDLFELDKNNE